MGIQKCKRLKPDAVPTLFDLWFDRPVIQLPSLAQSEPGPSRLSRKRDSTGSSSLADTTTKKITTAHKKRDLE